MGLAGSGGGGRGRAGRRGGRRGHAKAAGCCGARTRVAAMSGSEDAVAHHTAVCTSASDRLRRALVGCAP